MIRTLRALVALLLCAPHVRARCRSDICGDNANDCCAPGSEHRSCRQSGYTVTPGGTTTWPGCPQSGIYQCCDSSGGGASSTTCRARGYTYIGGGCDNSPQCSSWGSGGRCCGGGEGYCGSEWSSSNPGQWISVGSCTGLDFIRVWPGCAIEVATSGNGGPRDHSLSRTSL